ncbi:PREDICTED: glucose dehydrogenase [FAD, quinone]-like [Nicrophorus vespilloides]|uniref:Glucose dehydrogenase [FAD, quinone]-like n=1 Tax=Nicrophorus vespilloides TaxID=110193 RepID=A0ABM1M2P7_NICVS|nr:PREDICTED: glucose dehydrogenase [FAD, quinone]-like [Nicrophorus vespilloides]
MFYDLIAMKADEMLLDLTQETLINDDQFIAAIEEQLKIAPENPQLLPKYDFIIIGAGTSGCVVANRLSENPNWSILLIEAGNDENPLFDIPFPANLLQYTSANWNYRNLLNENRCSNSDGRECQTISGKVMGGSSTINYMIYTRGNHKDYDRWEDCGNVGWSYEHVLPYFKKIENFTINTLKESKYHGFNGFMHVGYPDFATKFVNVTIKAYKEFGLNYVDYNGKYQIGISRIQSNLKNGFRHSSNTAYINSFRRSNLHIIKLSIVKRILINPKTKRAYGVEFVSKGKSRSVLAEKEVILSAGAIRSPQMLMLSGIGPKKQLKNLKIPLIKNLPVGENLMDHIGINLLYTIEKPYTIPSNLKIDLTYTKQPEKNFQSIPGGVELISFHDLKDPFNPRGIPDVELLYFTNSAMSKSLLNITNDIYGFSILVLLLSPKSRGVIKLASNDEPLVYPNYLSDPEDVNILKEGVKLAYDISQQKAFKAIGAKLHDVSLGKCHFDIMSDAYVECIVRSLSISINHFCGTCKMGPIDDESSVVDDRLMVHGVNNLRVIDASIIPEIIKGHPHSVALMIGEKGSDMIKQDWNYTNSN